MRPKHVPCAFNDAKGSAGQAAEWSELPAPETGAFARSAAELTCQLVIL